jgi:hypothetical protein
LVARAVEVEPQPLLSVKGKTSPLQAYRLLGIRDDSAAAPARVTPFVGRERELAVLTAAIDRLRSSGRASHVLVLGDAGVGNSRLVETALERAGGVVQEVEGVESGIYHYRTGDHQLVRLTALDDDACLRLLERATAGHGTSPTPTSRS